MLNLRRNSLLGRFIYDPDMRMILVIFFPVFVDMILNNVISTVHSYLVAGVGEAAISGIGLVGTINSILTVVFASLPAAATILISQYRGAKNESGARKCNSQSLIMVTAFAILISAVMLLFPDYIFDIFFSKVDAEIFSQGKIYLFYSALSMPFHGIFQNGACVCRGYGNNKIPLFTSVTGSFLDVFLSFIFIIPLDMGVSGAGLGLLIARIFRAILVSVIIHKNRWFASLDELVNVDWKCLGAIAKLGLLSSSESLIVNLGATLKMRYIVEHGTAHITANSLHGTFFGLCSVPVTALATVTITLVGRYIGAGDKKETKNILKKIMILAIVIYALMMVIGFFLFPRLYPLYTDNPETLSLLSEMMYIHMAMTIIASPFVSIITNAFKGAGDAWFCTVVSVACMWIFNVGIGVFLSADFGLSLGVIGSLISGNLSLIITGVVYYVRYRSDRWIKKRLVD